MRREKVVHLSIQKTGMQKIANLVDCLLTMHVVGQRKGSKLQDSLQGLAVNTQNIAHKKEVPVLPKDRKGLLSGNLRSHKGQNGVDRLKVAGLVLISC